MMTRARNNRRDTKSAEGLRAFLSLRFSRLCGSSGRRTRAAANSAFSLLEMMVAVTLMLIIIAALLAVFYQTQRAFRLSVTQVDVLETGRAQMEAFVSELPEIVPSYRSGQVNLFAAT